MGYPYPNFAYVLFGGPIWGFGVSDRWVFKTQANQLESITAEI